jgi:phosphoenolpyruvate synthase/pyruvate phosphate dikinase
VRPSSPRRGHGIADKPPPAAASPGRVTGRAVFTSEEACDLADEDEEASIVLLRSETSPDDVPGMAVSAGVITATGGLVSHAAVVARGWGLPAVVGVESLVIDEAGDSRRAAGGAGHAGSAEGARLRTDPALSRPLLVPGLAAPGPRTKSGRRL